jgi:hypothetical protein
VKFSIFRTIEFSSGVSPVHQLPLLAKLSDPVRADFTHKDILLAVFI